MFKVAITGTGVFTPPEVITNNELVVAFNAYADIQNAANASGIAAGDVAEIPHSSAAFILAASGIEQRFVLNKSGILDPHRMSPALPTRTDEDPSIMAEIGVD
ncbi:MAG: beta-ketodecanoyl-[acyl-carrier-protein] synthase, partial [Yoonia sp.]